MVLRIFKPITSHPLLKIISSSLIALPRPKRISAIWTFGSLLGLCLAVQLASGVFLAMHFIASREDSFPVVLAFTQTVNLGWAIRIIHANGASLFFICLYAHVARGLYFSSFAFHETWGTGVILLFLVIATAFLGYVLPWGQISFWGATVITSLITAIPYLGQDVVLWLWGGFSVRGPTLTRFFTFHFLLPFVIAGVVILHFLFLHSSGSSNPLGLSLSRAKAPLYPYFLLKDLLGALAALLLLLGLALWSPWALGDPENFIPANPLIAPVHIQPEWYFLFAYAILRAIPNKLGGVLALVASVVILYLPAFLPMGTIKGLTFYPASQVLFWSLVGTALLLTWVGACPVESPYVMIGQILSLTYFSLFFIMPIRKLAQDWLLG